MAGGYYFTSMKTFHTKSYIMRAFEIILKLLCFSKDLEELFLKFLNKLAPVKKKKSILITVLLC